MTFSREPYQNAISKNEKIGTRENAYFRQRLKQAVFAKFVDAFAERAERYGLTKAKLATLTGKDPAAINRLLSLPSNLTLDTLSDMALAMGYEPEITLEPFEAAPRPNYSHEWMTPFLRESPPTFFVADNKYARLKGADAKPLEQAVS